MKHSLYASDEALTYNDDRLPLKYGKGVVKGDLEGDLSLHIHFITEGAHRLPVGKYCAIFEFRGNHREADWVDVADDSRLHPGSAHSRQEKRPMLVDDVQIFYEGDNGFVTRHARSERLQLLNDCPRSFVDTPNLEKATGSHGSASFIEREVFLFVLEYGELTSVRRMSNLNDREFIDGMAKRRPEVVHNLAYDSRPNQRQGLSAENEPLFAGLRIDLLTNDVMLTFVEPFEAQLQSICLVTCSPNLGVSTIEEGHVLDSSG